MKIRTFILALGIMSIGFASCKKCITCTYGPGKSSEDYCSLKQVDRDNITTQYEAAGGSCVDK